jgi:CBS domain containing-hemolysin-like protein
MPGLSLLQYAAVGLLILANAFFVAAEFALVSIRATRIEEMLTDAVPGARAVRTLQRELDDFLAAIQLGVTLCSLALGWIGEPLAASTLMGWMRALPIAPAHAQIYAHVTAIAAVALGFALITYFHVVVGELVPKSLALRRAESLALAVARPMLLFMALTRPAVRFLKSSAALILRGFDIPLTERAQVHSPDELKLIAAAARRLGVLPPYQESLIHRALELEEVPIREIMTPRQKIFSLPANLAVEPATAQIIEHKRSRVPVYDQSRGPDSIIGAVYSKDLARLMFFHSTKPVDNLTLRDVMRDILVFPETKSVLDLLRDLQQRRRPIAIVVDEYGSTVGLVTMEDAIEQLTGELEDEFDAPALPVLPTADGALLMDGGLNLRDLETEMQWDLPRKGGIETLAGFVLTRLGHIPKVGESITHEGRRLTVVEMDSRRIAKIRVEPVEQAPPPAN